MAATFVNPTNGYQEHVENAWLWWLLFGPLYFVHKGCYKHFLIVVCVVLLLRDLQVAAVLAVITGGVLPKFPYLGVGLLVLWIVYAFFAHDCVCNSYRARGWQEVGRKGLRA